MRTDNGHEKNFYTQKSLQDIYTDTFFTHTLKLKTRTDLSECYLPENITGNVDTGGKFNPSTIPFLTSERKRMRF